jgi:GntR family transcriptional regulator
MKKLIGLPDLQNGTHMPLYIQISNNLIQYIRRNQLAKGEAIPSENELLSRYDVSRTTVRQAIQHLESQHIVHRVRGKGTFVAAPKRRQYVRGFQNLEDQLKELGIVATNDLLDYKTVLPPNTCAEQLGLNPSQKVLLIRRLKLADTEPLALEERFLPLDIAMRFQKEDFEDMPVFNVLDREPDLSIVRVAYTIASSPLSESESKIMKVDQTASVIRRTGIYYNMDEKPVMFSRITFLADKAELRFEFHKEDDNWGVVSVV